MRPELLLLLFQDKRRTYIKSHFDRLSVTLTYSGTPRLSVTLSDCRTALHFSQHDKHAIRNLR
jgi:hypothetical protein